jgi:hypothetical protein
MENKQEVGHILKDRKNRTYYNISRNKKRILKYILI